MCDTFDSECLSPSDGDPITWLRWFFPLPLFHVESSHKSLGRGCAQRISKRAAESNRCNEAVQALNYLSGCDGSRPVNNCSAREHVLTRTKTAVYNFGTPDSSESVEAALQALLHSKSSYVEGPIGPATFDCARLSLPDSAGVLYTCGNCW